MIIAMLFALKNLIGDRLILTKDGIVWSGDLDPVYQQAGNMSDTLRQLVKNNPETIRLLLTGWQNLQNKTDIMREMQERAGR